MPKGARMPMQEEYKSSPKKLIRFFVNSRDNWKEKTIEVKYDLKICKKRIRFLETSKAKLKFKEKELREKQNELQSELLELRSELQRQREENKRLAEAAKKKSASW